MFQVIILTSHNKWRPVCLTSQALGCFFLFLLKPVNKHFKHLISILFCVLSRLFYFVFLCLCGDLCNPEDEQGLSSVVLLLSITTANCILGLKSMSHHTVKVIWKALFVIILNTNWSIGFPKTDPIRFIYLHTHTHFSFFFFSFLRGHISTATDS